MRTRDELVIVGLVVAGLVLLGGSAKAAPKPGTKYRGPLLVNHPRTGLPLRGGMGSRRLSSSEIRQLAQQHGVASPDVAVTIAMRESGGRVGAWVDTRGLSDQELHDFWGPTYDGQTLHEELSVGLWQFNLLVWAKADPEGEKALLEDDENAQAELLAKVSQHGTYWAPWHRKGDAF